jgi:hypothetical protein
MDGFRRLADATPGDWIRPRLLEWGTAGMPAGAVVPTGFERVVRVLHPAGDDARPWRDVAADAGRVVHPLVQWWCIAPHLTGWGRDTDVDPEEGSVPVATLDAILQHCPAEGDVFHAVWDGFGFWTEPRPDLTSLVRGRGRDYLLFAGPKVAVTRWPGMQDVAWQSANLVWPPDRSWCVAAEIDWDSTLVAGTAATCAAILADPRLEAFEVDYGDDLSWFGDTVNPRPDWLPDPRS